MISRTFFSLALLVGAVVVLPQVVLADGYVTDEIQPSSYEGYYNIPTPVVSAEERNLLDFRDSGYDLSNVPQSAWDAMNNYFENPETVLCANGIYDQIMLYAVQPAPPTAPTCDDSGQLGTYPSCYTPSCDDYGQEGNWPNCTTPPNPSCSDFGQSGTYPNCSNLPTPPPDAPPQAPPAQSYYEASYGDSCVSNQGNPCLSASNSCGMFNSGVVQCDGSCSASMPSNALCPAIDATVEIEVNPERVAFGQTATVAWSSENATSCSVTGPGLSSAAVSGSAVVTVTTQQTYTINCNGATAFDIVNVGLGLEEF